VPFSKCDGEHNLEAAEPYDTACPHNWTVEQALKHKIMDNWVGRCVVWSYSEPTTTFGRPFGTCNRGREIVSAIIDS
jgi:pyruvate-formate lyase-activating enzyme